MSGDHVAQIKGCPMCDTKFIPVAISTEYLGKTTTNVYCQNAETCNFNCSLEHWNKIIPAATEKEAYEVIAELERGLQLSTAPNLFPGVRYIDSVYHVLFEMITNTSGNDVKSITDSLTTSLSESGKVNQLVPFLNTFEDEVAKMTMHNLLNDGIDATNGLPYQSPFMKRASALRIEIIRKFNNLYVQNKKNRDFNHKLIPSPTNSRNAAGLADDLVYFTKILEKNKKRAAWFETNEKPDSNRTSKEKLQKDVIDAEQKVNSIRELLSKYVNFESNR